jgi:phosphatidylglycerol:prolipoprotein diacylglycerol transferase
VFPKIPLVGDFYLPTYGVMVAIGFLAGLSITARLARRAGLDPERVSNIAVYAALAGLIGAKLLMFVVDFQYYWNRSDEILTFATLRAGGVFYGGLVCALYFGHRLIRKYGLPVLPTFDIYGPGLALGQALGRLGCFAAGCCWGDLCTRPWKVRYTSPDAMELTGVPLNVDVHPSQLYEAALSLAVFAITYRIAVRPHPPGSVIGWYLVLASAARFGSEFFRFHQQPNPFGLWFSTAQWISLALLALGCRLLLGGPRARLA